MKLTLLGQMFLSVLVVAVAAFVGALMVTAFTPITIGLGPAALIAGGSHVLTLFTDMWRGE